MKYFIRPAEDWLGAFLAMLLTLAVIACISSCEPAHAEPSEVVLQTIAMESGGESLEGQAWVAKTIQTRSKRGKISPQDVVLRPKQYSCWNSPKWAKAWLARHYGLKARGGAVIAWNRALKLPYQVTHYHTIDIKPYWAVGHIPKVVVGRHAFYDDVK